MKQQLTLKNSLSLNKTGGFIQPTQHVLRRTRCQIDGLAWRRTFFSQSMGSQWRSFCSHTGQRRRLTRISGES